jgi:hypothetical protein
MHVPINADAHESREERWDIEHLAGHRLSLCLPVFSLMSVPGRESNY